MISFTNYESYLVHLIMKKKSFVSLNCKISVRYKKIIVQIYFYNTYIYLHCFAYFDTTFKISLISYLFIFYLKNDP